jgi:prepilin peptidase CpaA
MSPHEAAILRLFLTAICAGIIVPEDLRYRRIPNVTAIALFSGGLVLAAASSGISGTINAVLGATAGFAIFLLPYLLGGMGAGDVKLLGAFGALVGLSSLLPTVILIAVAGGIGAVASVLVARIRTQKAPRAIAYGPAIVLGSVLVLASQLGGK